VLKQQRSTMQHVLGCNRNTKSCTNNRACYETATFNDATCMAGTQDPAPATACYETATFNDATCTWDITEHKNQHQQQRVKQQRSTMLMYWDVTGTQDPPANRVL
jgi:hypothetical protein